MSPHPRPASHDDTTTPGEKNTTRDASPRPERTGFTCATCGRFNITRIEGLFHRVRAGSPQRFCDHACRQAAYRRRRAGAAEDTPCSSAEGGTGGSFRCHGNHNRHQRSPNPMCPARRRQYEATVPTIADRVAQTVVAMHLGVRAEPVFHLDSYGYRPSRSALDAVGVCRTRCWKFDWAIDLDVQKFFDTVPWDLVVKAVEAVCDTRWVLLYVKRWLAAPLQHADGTVVERDKGTPQGGLCSAEHNDPCGVPRSRTMMVPSSLT